MTKVPINPFVSISESASNASTASSITSNFVADHFPHDLAVVAKTLVGIGCFVGTFSVGVWCLKEYLLRHERRRLWFNQRPPPVPVFQGIPVSQQTNNYWVNKATKHRREYASNTSSAASPAKPRRTMSRISSLPSESAFEEFANQSRSYKILSLDGGGVRGVITAVILQRLMEVFPDLL